MDNLWAELQASAEALANLNILTTGETTMKQHHFIIAFDTETKKWYWDVDQEETRFDDGTIYDKATNQWSSGYLGDGIYEDNEENLGEQLNESLNFMNSKVSA